MYAEVNFDAKCLMTNPVTVTKKWILFLPDMPHLTKNIVTSLKLSSSKKSKWNLRYSIVPINMHMTEEVWLKCEGASRQLQSTNLTAWHVDKNASS